MNECLFCEKELTSDIGYITDGKIKVCMLCAGRYTLNDVFLATIADGINTNIERIYVPAFEYTDNGLTGQTNFSDLATYEDIAKPDTLFDDIVNLSEKDFMSKYTDDTRAIDTYMRYYHIGIYADKADVDDGTDESV